MKIFDIKKSWFLSDAQKIADEFRYTFHKPSSEAIGMLKPGDEVKLIFKFNSTDPEAPSAERMWVEIVKVEPWGFQGTLDNDPEYIDDIECGETLKFSAKHIIQVSIDDPVPSEVEKYIKRCFVTRKVLYEGCKIGYLYREEPDSDKDSGWRILAGDESEEYMEESDNVCWVSLGAVLREDDNILDLLELPIGSTFQLETNSGKFVERIEDST